MEKEISNEELKIIHKVVKCRTVQKKGIVDYRKKIAGKLNELTFGKDKLDKFMAPGEKLYDLIAIDEYKGFPEEKWREIINYIIICATSPIMLAVCLACFPVNLLREAFYRAKNEDLEKLADAGIYHILKERIGAGYDNPELVEQDIIKDVEEMRKAK